MHVSTRFSSALVGVILVLSPAAPCRTALAAPTPDETIKAIDRIASEDIDKKKVASYAVGVMKDGRLILSTPTALYGQMAGDMLSVEEDKDNPDRHVRVGYQGIELDRLLQKYNLVTLKRIYNGYILS